METEKIRKRRTTITKEIVKTVRKAHLKLLFQKYKTFVSKIKLLK